MRTYDSSDEAEVSRHHVFEVVGDEHSAYVQLDLVHLLAVAGEGVTGCLLGNEEDRLEGDFALRREVGVRHRVCRVLAKASIELVVFFVFNLARPK